jgi:hypothetical protein
MQADTRLKDAQYRTEVRKTALAIVGTIVAAMGAGAGLLAGVLALEKWHAGAP